MSSPTKPSCCSHTHDDDGKKGFTFDPILHGSLVVITSVLIAHFSGAFDYKPLDHFAHTIIELSSQMWWGVLIGMVFVGIMAKIPRHYFNAALGDGDKAGGILRAAAAGLLFDLCSHGILMIGSKLYERGASLAQVMTFLIASPWNSFSLTLILISLIGFGWTMVFIVASALVAILTGLIVSAMTKAGALPENPNKVSSSESPINLKQEMIKDLKSVQWNFDLVKDIFKGSKHEAAMLLRWLLLGIILAAAIRSFIPTESFAQWFGPSLAGLGLTLLATSLIEVCSEGSSPIAAELLNRAHAPGNAFAFLMAGVSTDYTEIMVLKDTTKSWKMALMMPLVTIPQILILGYILNLMG